MKPALAERVDWSSRSEMESYLGDRPHVVVGRDAESPREYCSFHVMALTGFELLVWSSGLGIKPKAFVLSDSTLVLGHDQRVTLIDAISPSIKNSVLLDGAFYDLFVISDERFIAVHEVGVVMLGGQGEVIWRVDTEIIAAWQMASHDRLALTMMESGKTCLVHLSTGKADG
jgi:hypothetical protein